MSRYIKVLLVFFLAAIVATQTGCKLTEKTVDKGGAEVGDGIDNDDGNETVALDSDGDGLPDSTETLLGTDPNDADSDNDGLTDGAEVQTHRTNPLNADTDGGGKNDGQEVLDGSNPLNGSDDVPPADPDSDGDGLDDVVEAFLGTDPNDTDSDDDGLTDGAEVTTHKSDPLDADTDDGGINDGQEVSNGTNPLDSADDIPPPNPDSDGDGLDDTTETNIGTDPNDTDSDDDGLTDGAEVKTHNTNPLAADTDGGSKNDGDEVNTGTNPVDASDDIPPTDPDSDDDGLDDVLEAALGTDPNNDDTDDDGLKDGAEVKTHSTNPNAADTDGGGVNDGREVSNGTNPLNASDDTPPVDPDTDDDGLIDAFEALIGTDPDNPDSDGDGLTDGAEVQTHGTSPTNADTDGGGEEDGDEISAGTNPLNAADDQPPIDEDSDDDGLNDATEEFIGTDPNDPDTDGDGLTDGAEVKTHFTSPLIQDTDGGGIDDGQEVDDGTNPLDSNDDEVPDPSTIVFTQSPESETTETTATIEFDLQNFPGIQSLECRLNEETVPCEDKVPTEISGLEPGDHEFTVIVKDENDEIFTSSVSWKVKEPEPQDPCRDGHTQTDSYRVFYPNPNQVCAFGEGENLPKKQGKVRAHRVQRGQLALPENVRLCGMQIDIPEQKFKYDDDFAVTWNDVALIARGDHILSVRDDFYIFDFSKVKNKTMTDDYTFCFGKGLGTQCQAPATERTGNVSLNISQAAMSHLNQKFATTRTHNIDLVTTGDNDNSDCQHTGLTVNVTVTYGELD